MKRIWLWAPFILFAILIGVFARGLLYPTDRVVASGMVGRHMPAFVLDNAVPANPALDSKQFADGKPRLLNIFGSWCQPCIVEAPMLMQLQAQGAEILGIAIHDEPDRLARFLATNGNPYVQIGLDPKSRTQIDFGSAGVPETFVVDGNGVISYQHVGIITPDDVPIIMAKLKGVR